MGSRNSLSGFSLGFWFVVSLFFLPTLATLGVFGIPACRSSWDREHPWLCKSRRSVFRNILTPIYSEGLVLLGKYVVVKAKGLPFCTK